MAGDMVGGVTGVSVMTESLRKLKLSRAAAALQLCPA